MDAVKQIRMNNCDAFTYAEKADRLILLSDAVESASEPNGTCQFCGDSTDLDGESCPEAILCTECDSEIEDLSDEIG